MTSKKEETAAEFIARLNADPAFVARREQREAERQERESEWRRAEAPLVEELRAAGLKHIESVWDLVNAVTPYSEVLPILLDHMQRSYPDAIRDGIARALAVPEAKFGLATLTKLYRLEKVGRVKEGLAVAIANIANDEQIEEVISLAEDRANGESRILLLSVLERSTDPRARRALSNLRADPQLSKEIRAILRRIGK